MNYTKEAGAISVAVIARLIYILQESWSSSSNIRGSMNCKREAVAISVGELAVWIARGKEAVLVLVTGADFLLLLWPSTSTLLELQTPAKLWRNEENCKGLWRNVKNWASLPLPPAKKCKNIVQLYPYDPAVNCTSWLKGTYKSIKCCKILCRCTLMTLHPAYP